MNPVLTRLEQCLGSGGAPILEGEPVSVIQWPSLEGEGDVALATIGMSDFAQTVPQGKRCLSATPRTELLLYCRRELALAVAHFLVDLAHYPRTQKTFLHWGHDLPLGLPLAPGSALTGLLLAFPPFESPECATFTVAGSRIDVLWVVPITDSERRFKIQNGSDAVHDRLEEADADIADFLRAAVV